MAEAYASLLVQPEISRTNPSNPSLSSSVCTCLSWVHAPLETLSWVRPQHAHRLFLDKLLVEHTQEERPEHANEFCGMSLQKKFSLPGSREGMSSLMPNPSHGRPKTALDNLQTIHFCLMFILLSLVRIQDNRTTHLKGLRWAPTPCSTLQTPPPTRPPLLFALRVTSSHLPLSLLPTNCSSAVQEPLDVRARQPLKSFEAKACILSIQSMNAMSLERHAEISSKHKLTLTCHALQIPINRPTIALTQREMIVEPLKVCSWCAHGKTIDGNSAACNVSEMSLNHHCASLHLLRSQLAFLFGNLLAGRMQCQI